jgi:O-antigen/teichoic acid export membrane protein
MTAANLVAFATENIDTATVGRVLGAADVGYYNIAWRLSNFPATGIGYIVGRVMFPVYATIKDDRPAFREAFLTNVRRVALVSLPVGVGILLAARPLVVGIFGQRWEPAVAPLEILAIYGLTRAFAGTTVPVLQAAGRPRLVFVLQVWLLAVLCAGLFTLTPAFGIDGAAGAVTLASAVTLVPAFRFALRTLDLPLRTLLEAIERPVVCTLLLALCLLALRLTTDLGALSELALLTVCGLVVYAGSAFVLARGELRAITTAFRSS